MNAIDPPRLLGPPLGSAMFKSRPEDFLVEEVLGFTPSGEGEHCLLWIEKTDLNSNDVAAHLATALGIRKRLVSHCGLKDKAAITRQWFSIHLPGQPSPLAEDLRADGIRVLQVTRNRRKLHRGSHDGNRFSIRLRECNFSRESAAMRWQEICQRGVPNYFGPQRFGDDGGNVEKALKLMSGEIEIRDRLVRGILISAARSFLFNAIVAERVRLKTWDKTLPGEVFGFAANRSLVMPDNLHGDEADRVWQGTLELTAALWGGGENPTRDHVQLLEENIAQRYPEIVRGLTQFEMKQERRVMRLRPRAPQCEWPSASELVLRFDLPKGTYATAILRELVQLA